MSLAGNGSSVFAGTARAIMRSTDNGVSLSWTRSDVSAMNVNCLTVASDVTGGTYIFAGTGGGGVFLSTDKGTSWTSVNSGLTNLYVYSLALDGADLFAGTDGGVYLTSFTELITSVGRPSTDLPPHFNLGQNYPNPFNLETIISFSVSSRSFVSIIVYDALGREVSILRSEELPAGEYLQRWNAASMPSGVYFYRLLAGEFVETKKMILLH